MPKKPKPSSNDEDQTSESPPKFISSSELNLALGKFIKWIKHKSDPVLSNQRDVIGQMSQGLSTEYSPETVGFLMNLVLHRCLLTKKSGIPPKQVNSLKNVIQTEKDLHSKIRELFTAELTKRVREIQKKKTLSKSKMISKAKALDIDGFLYTIINNCPDYEQKTETNLDLEEKVVLALREIGVLKSEINSTDWILLMIDMVGVVLNSQNNHFEMGKNALNFLVNIMKSVMDIETACSLKFQIFKKIMNMFIIAQDHQSKEVRKKATKILSKTHNEVIHKLYFPLKKASNNLIKIFENKQTKKKGKKKKALKNKQTQKYKALIENLEENLEQIESITVLLTSQVLTKFQKKYSCEEQASSLDLLLKFLLNLCNSQESVVYERVKQNVFLHRGKIVEFLVTKAYTSSDFDSILDNFLELETFNAFETDSVNFDKSIVLKTKQKMKLDLKGHCFLDNMVYSDYTVNEYRGQIMTQKNYLMVFLLMLNPNPEISRPVTQRMLNFLRKAANFRNLGEEQEHTSYSKEEFLEILMILFQMALLRMGQYQECFQIESVSESFALEFSNLLGVLRNHLWTRKLIGNLVNWYLSLSPKFRTSPKPNQQYSVEEVLCQGILGFFEKCFQGNEPVDPNEEMALTSQVETKNNNHHFLLSIFSRSRDELFLVTFSKIKAYSKANENSQFHISQSSEQAILFTKLLKKELRTSQEDLFHTKSFSQELEQVKDPRLLRNLIEWLYIFEKRYTQKIEVDDSCRLHWVFEKNRLYLQEFMETNPGDLDEASFTCLLRVRFSAVYLTNSENLFKKLGFFKQIREQWQNWNYRIVESLKSILNLSFCIMQSVFLRIFDIKRETNKEELVNAFMQTRSDTLNILQEFCKFESQSLSFRETLEIRKEAFELLIKTHMLLSNDIFSKYKLVYTQAREKDISHIKEFLGKTLGLYSKSKSRGDVQEMQSQMLTSDNKKRIEQTREVMSSLLEDQISNSNETPRKSEHPQKELPFEFSEQAKVFFASVSGRDVQYYLTLLVFELMEECSFSFGILLGPDLISKLAGEGGASGNLSPIVLSFLTKLLNQDTLTKPKAVFWKYYVKTLQLEGSSRNKANITKVFLKIYRAKLAKLNKLEGALKSGGDHSQERSLLLSNFLNCTAYLINVMDPKSKDYQGKVSYLLKSHLLKRKNFQSNRIYTEILLLLHKKTLEFDDSDLNVQVQKTMLENFVEKESIKVGNEDEKDEDMVLPKIAEKTEKEDNFNQGKSDIHTKIKEEITEENNEGKFEEKSEMTIDKKIDEENHPKIDTTKNKKRKNKNQNKRKNKKPKNNTKKRGKSKKDKSRNISKPKRKKKNKN